jgi:Outer membrane protein beta-barrel domain
MRGVTVGRVRGDAVSRAGTAARLLGSLALVGAVAGSASAGPLIDPTLASELPDVVSNPAHGREVLRLADDPTPTGSPAPAPWSDALTPLGLGLGVSRFQSDLQRAVPLADFLNPQEMSLTAFGLSLQSGLAWGRDGREGPLRPYVGLGPAVFITSLSDISLRPGRGPFDVDAGQAEAVERTGAAVGLQGQAGLRYSLSKSWSVFGEYRLTRPAYGLPGLDEDAGKALGVHRFQGGLSIQFR